MDNVNSEDSLPGLIIRVGFSCLMMGTELAGFTLKMGSVMTITSHHRYYDIESRRLHRAV